MDQKDYIEKLRRRLFQHSKLVLDILIFFSWLTSAIMFIIVSAGIFTILWGVLFELQILKADDENIGIIKILHGLELIFVSPLLYFLILSLIKYFSAIKPEVDPDLSKKKEYVKHSLHEITNVKILTVSLFISLLILHSIKLVLQKEMDSSSIVYIISILIILIGYYFILDNVAEKLRDDTK